LAGRLGWQDEVFIDLIGRGFLSKVRDEFDKVDKPETLFEATNLIIGLDKKCLIENRLNYTPSYHNKSHKTYSRKKHELNKTENKHKNFHSKNNLRMMFFSPIKYLMVNPLLVLISI